MLEIKAPFTEIGNSGQVWKFMDIPKLSKILQELSESERQGTNLVIVQKYFGNRARDSYRIVQFTNWITCNTLADFLHINQMEDAL